MKTCPDCGVTKPIDQFSRAVKNKDGHYPYCKTCNSIRHKAAYAARGKKSWMNDKVCSWCRVLKPRTEYSRGLNGRIHPRCMKCEVEIAAGLTRGVRRCSSCQEWKKIDLFYPSKLEHTHITCIECVRKYTASRTEARRNYVLKKTYGISLDRYRQLLKHQNYRCPICTEPLDPDSTSYPVDHAHSGKFRGRIRAITHRDCNRFVLWTHEDARQLRAAADLIENPLTEWMVPENMINAYEKRPK